MTKKSTKSKVKTKTPSSKKNKECSQGIRPSVGIIFTLGLALIIAITVGVCTFQFAKKSHDDMTNSKLSVFNHLLESFVDTMEFNTADDGPIAKQITGYGVSDEDGVFYATFDYAPYTISDDHQITYGDTHHAIVYFWKDKERGTYSHAFSYHDDASYHPGGEYIKIEE